MANAVNMSTVLTQFDNSGIIDGLSSIKSARSSVASTVNSVLNAFSDLSSTVKSTFLDSAGDSLHISFSLLRDASSRLHNSFEASDMPRIINETEKVGKIIREIKASRAEILNTKIDWGIEELDSTAGAYTGKDARVNRLNHYIEYLNREGERQLNAIRSSSSSIRLGIIGNMKYGGSLGKHTSFDTTYDFVRPAFVDTPNEVTSGFWDFFANIGGIVGTFVVGTVEGVIKFGEGIVDAGLTAASWAANVVGLTGLSDTLSNIAKYDVAGTLTGVAYDFLKEHGIYNDAARTAGVLVGQVTAATALFVATGGASTGLEALIGATKAATVLSALSAGGQTSEGVLQSGKDINQAFLYGTAATVFSLVLPKIGSRIMKAPIVSRITDSSVVRSVTSTVKSVFSKVARSAPAKLVMFPAKTLATLQAKVLSGGVTVAKRVMSPVVGLTSKVAKGMFPKTHAKFTEKVAAATEAKKDAMLESIKKAASADTEHNLNYGRYKTDDSKATKNVIKAATDSRKMAAEALKPDGTYVFSSDETAEKALEAINSVRNGNYHATELKTGMTPRSSDFNTVSYYGNKLQQGIQLTAAESNKYQASLYNILGYGDFNQEVAEQLSDLFFMSQPGVLRDPKIYSGAVVGTVVDEIKR